MSHEHECFNSKRIDKLEAAIYGNGQPGLVQIVSKLDATLEGTRKAMEDNAVAMRGITKHLATLEGRAEGKNEKKKLTRWLIGITITILLAYIGTLFVFLK